MKKFLIIVVASLGFVGCDQNSQSLENNSSPAEFFDLVNTPVGEVEFETSCNFEAQKLVERGVALTHHMMYEEANFVFGMADNADPECAMAYWGQAMTLINPLWPTTPSDEQMQKGTDLVVKALEKETTTDREKAYIKTTEAYFIGGSTRSENERLRRFEDAWSSLSYAYPDDEDAKAFSLLSSLSTANPKDRALVKQRAVGEGVKVLLEEHPNHPGAHHYLIHAYDYPPLADQALPIADHYGEITPRVAHATHMMTHIYTRLGLWEKAIEWNDVSAQSALSICNTTGKINGHYTHALDFLAYAYLQKADDASVLEILDTSRALSLPYSGNLHAPAYAFSAIPARYALERGDWDAASKIEPRMPSTFPWTDTYDPYVAISHFARAIGLARSGRPQGIDAEIESMKVLKENVSKRSGYWAEQIEIQIQTAQAWQAYSEGNATDGLAKMKSATALAATTEKHAITPGEVLPAMELYGDMLLELEQFDEALIAYQRSLERVPNRLNSLYGAAKAAEAAGDIPKSKKYYKDILALANNEKSMRPTVKEARQKVGNL